MAKHGPKVRARKVAKFERWSYGNDAGSPTASLDRLDFDGHPALYLQQGVDLNARNLPAIVRALNAARVVPPKAKRR